MNRYPSENWKTPCRPINLNVCPEADARCKSMAGAVYYRPSGRKPQPVRRLTAKPFPEKPTARHLFRHQRRLAFLIREFPELRQAATA